MRLLFFTDLRERRIVKTWKTLNDWIDNRGFPPGRILARHRAWTEDEVFAWIASLPTGKEPVRGNAKRNVEEARKRREQQAGATKAKRKSRAAA
jgi:hypothetical protein